MSKPKRYDLTVYLDRKDKLSPSYYPIYFEVFRSFDKLVRRCCNFEAVDSMLCDHVCFKFEVFDEIRGTFIINDIVEAFRDA